MERSRDIHGNPPVDILGEAVETDSIRLKHLAMGIFSLLLLLGLVCAAYTGAVANSKGHAEGPWFLGGLLLGPLALLAAVGLPDLKLRKYLRLLAEHQGAVEKE